MTARWSGGDEPADRARSSRRRQPIARRIGCSGGAPLLPLSCMLLLGLTACAPQMSDRAPEDPVAREEALARNDPWHAAKLRGVAFRAVGQEPGWLLEITDGEAILIDTDYGQVRRSFAYVEPRVDQARRRTVYRVAPDVRILIEGRSCTDVMSGEGFEVTVTLTLGEDTLAGCGRALF